MKNWFGFLLKYYRLKNNLSQEGICKGICTVSYLSKIENGTAQPSQEIIEQLFAVLGINTYWDDALLADTKKLFEAYFDKIFFLEDVSQEAEKIKASMDTLEISPLYIDFQLFKIQEAALHSDLIEIRQRLDELKPFLPYIDENKRVFYELAVGDAYEDEEAYLRADAFSPCYYCKYKLANLYYVKGQYQKALQYCAKAYELAAYEGNIAIMSEMSLTEGNCYCNLHQIDLMVQSFNRCLNLNRNNDLLLKSIYYNIGSTYLEVGNDQKALEYLKLSEGDQINALDKFLTYHKLAMVYCNLNQSANSLAYAEKAEAILEQGLIYDGYEDIYEKMIKIIRMMINHDLGEEYLQILKEVYDECGKRIIYGYQQFYGLILIKAYKANRRYKEALSLYQQMQNNIINM